MRNSFFWAEKKSVKSGVDCQYADLIRVFAATIKARSFQSRELVGINKLLKAQTIFLIIAIVSAAQRTHPR